MAVLKPAAQAVPSEQEIAACPIPTKKGKEHSIDLALDLSTSCIGWAVGVDRELFNWGKLVFKSTADIGEKLQAAAIFLRFLCDTYKPTRILVEKTLARRGDTTLRHAELAGVVRLVWRQYINDEILKSWFVPSKTVKTLLNVERGRNHDHNKEIMVNKINDLYNLHFHFDKNSKLKSDDDVADAIAVLTAFWRANARRR